MKIPKICTKSAPLDDDRAGWYVQNSVSLRDIRPDWRFPGGGVTKGEFSDLPAAIDKAISYTKSRIAQAEEHLRTLEAAKAELSA